jgi:hypothetical protein
MLGDDGKEDPSSKIQAPEKRQTPGTKIQTAARGVFWELLLGSFLDLGALGSWCFSGS